MDNSSRRDALLRSQKLVDNDGFYTRPIDIDEEMSFHSVNDFFKGKKVFCNCNDGDWSAIFKHFVNNFDVYGLKEVIGTEYAGVTESEKKDAGDNIDLTYGDEEEEKIETKKTGKAIKYTGNDNYEVTILKGDGSYASQECLDLLDKCDVVVTNPPFSLFTHFLPLMEKSGKDFIVLGPCTAVTKVDIFPYILSGKVHINHKQVTKFQSMTGRLRDQYDTEKMYTPTGANSYWFSNKKQQRPIKEVKRFEYNPKLHPKYATADIIDINSIKRIPTDYQGLMAVPMTYLDKLNTEIFTLVNTTAKYGIKPKKVVKLGYFGEEIGKPTSLWHLVDYVPELHNDKYGNVQSIFKDKGTGKTYKSVFNRILIKNRTL